MSGAASGYYQLNKPVESDTSEVVRAISAAEANPTAGKKAWATRALRKYIVEQSKLGDPERIRAGLKASITRKRNLSIKENSYECVSAI